MHGFDHPGPEEYGNEYQSLIPEWGDEAGVSGNASILSSSGTLLFRSRAFRKSSFRVHLYVCNSFHFYLRDAAQATQTTRLLFGIPLALAAL